MKPTVKAQRVLAGLMRHPELSLISLGKKLGMPSQTVIKYYNRFRAAGVFKGKALCIDQVALNLHSTVFLYIKTPEPTKFFAVMQDDDHIQEIYVIPGEWDCVCKVRLPLFDMVPRLIEYYARLVPITKWDAVPVLAIKKESAVFPTQYISNQEAFKALNERTLDLFGKPRL